jgi:hypothetical protein
VCSQRMQKFQETKGTSAGKPALRGSLSNTAEAVSLSKTRPAYFASVQIAMAMKGHHCLILPPKP